MHHMVIHSKLGNLYFIATNGINYTCENVIWPFHICISLGSYSIVLVAVWPFGTVRALLVFRPC